MPRCLRRSCRAADRVRAFSHLRRRSVVRRGRPLFCVARRPGGGDRPGLVRRLVRSCGGQVAGAGTAGGLAVGYRARSTLAGADRERVDACAQHAPGRVAGGAQSPCARMVALPSWRSGSGGARLPQWPHHGIHSHRVAGRRGHRRGAWTGGAASGRLDEFAPRALAEDRRPTLGSWMAASGLLALAWGVRPGL